MPARELAVHSKCFDFRASVSQEIKEQFLRGSARRCTGSPREVGRAQNKEKVVLFFVHAKLDAVSKINVRLSASTLIFGRDRVGFRIGVRVCHLLSRGIQVARWLRSGRSRLSLLLLDTLAPVSYTHLRAHETEADL
eukprot:1588412-Rhodomonas_salina.2